MITKQMVRALLDHDLEVYSARAHELFDRFLKDYSDDEDVTDELSGRVTTMALSNPLRLSMDNFPTDEQVMLKGGLSLEFMYADYPSAHNFYRWLTAHQESKNGTKKPAAKRSTMQTNELNGGANE